MNQARSEEEENERKKDMKGRGQETDGKKGSPTKQNLPEELKQGPHVQLRLRGSAKLRYFFLLLKLEAWNMACICKIEIP